jgi:hypothetical protein
MAPVYKIEINAHGDRSRWSHDNVLSAKVSTKIRRQPVAAELVQFAYGLKAGEFFVSCLDVGGVQQTNKLRGP